MKLPSSNKPRRRSRQSLTIVTVLVALLLVVGGGLTFFLIRNNRTKPDFPSLTETPDSSLVGTVAYLEAKTNCIRLIALSGASSRQLYCPPAWSTADAEKYGKPTSPQLIWLDGGKLELTFFRMTKTPGPNVLKGWQQVIDVATGAVTDTPDAQVPSSPNLTARPTTNSAGDKVKFSSDSESGRVKVWIEKKNGDINTVLDERGPSNYTYGMNSAFWGPDGKTIFAEDGRILVITPDKDPTVRTLIEEGEFGFEADDSARSSFAVTTENYVTTPSK